MTAKIFYKELRLVAHPTVYLFLCLGAMMLIPNYPLYVTFFYGTLGVFFSFLGARENQDVYYAAALPVSKRNAVRGRTLFVAAAELAQVLSAVPFALLRAHLPGIGENLAGIEPNVAFFGLSLCMLGLFNVIFLPAFYKTAQKVGRAFLLAVLPMTAYILAAEALVHFPVVGAYLDAVDAHAQVRQLPVLLGGAALYALLTWLGFRSAAVRFARVDL